jgi:hypothetical protein
MAGQPFYTVKQAAELMEMPEPQVEGFVQQKLLAANFIHNIMTYVITHDDLVAFMKDRKLWKQLQKVMVSRVLLCDRDQKATFILKNELERGGKCQVRIATSSKDAAMIIDEWMPDLLVMHLAAVQRETDSLAGVLRRARESRPLKIVIYHNQPDALVKDKEDVQRIIEYLNVDSLVSVAAGTRGLLTTMMEMLGLRTTMRIIRPFGATPTPPPQPKVQPPGSPPAPGAIQEPPTA